jgi:ubiquinone biosynthesis protein
VNRLRSALRLVRIQWILVRHGLDELVVLAPLFRPLRGLIPLLPWHWIRRRTPLPVRLRLALEALGPIYIKFGQTLSTRRDLLPPAYADELARLQDRVPPFPAEDARKIVSAELARPVEALFARFEDQPLASASLAQVHAASLRGGEEVVVKILRPGIEKTIRRDLDLLALLAGLVEHYHPYGRRLRPREIVAEFDRTLMHELDLTLEAANAVVLRRNARPDLRLYVPRVFWDYTRTRVLVLERVKGIPIADQARLRALGVDRRALAVLGVHIFFTQVFVDNFFHADMHPGNLFVDASDPRRPALAVVDFGIVGTLSADDRYYLAANVHAFFNRDYRRIAELHIRSGWVPPGTSPEELESAVRSVCEPIFGRPLHEISLGLVLTRLLSIARRFDVTIKPELLLLQKTLIAVEGLGRELDPELDLWRTARPLIARWMRRNAWPTPGLQRLRRELPAILERVPALLKRLEEPPPRPPPPRTFPWVESAAALFVGAGLATLALSPTLRGPALALALLGFGTLLLRARRPPAP